MTLPAGWVVRRATPDDAPAFSRCYAAAVALTYAHLMPPEFAEARFAEIDHVTATVREHIEDGDRARAAGREPHRTYWVSIDADGEFVGVASVGPGRDRWDIEMGHPDPPILFNLDKIYLLPRAQGSGLGQAMLDAVLPARRGAWLWILRDNDRAEAFYRRNGFIDEPYETTCGDLWFHRPMFRMWRPDPAPPPDITVSTDAPRSDAADYDQTERPVPDAKARDER
ncbi:MAG TPA: GNAT family N-acetyltransferase [Propionibacteriaceae bacterium]|nr:GNAT family N-acetyltransferase [Propionibacteriaceae bacterium]